MGSQDRKESAGTMARPREFDIDDALERAMNVFWAKGYEATSMADLMAAMKLSKSSLYDTFGSKHALFISALERYNERVAGPGISAIVEGAGGGTAGIAAVFEKYVEDFARLRETRGCFIGNCAVELGARDEICTVKVAEGLATMEAIFQGAVETAKARGEIPETADARRLARYLTSSLNGLIVLGKADADRQTLEDIVDTVMKSLS